MSSEFKSKRLENLQREIAEMTPQEFCNFWLAFEADHELITRTIPEVVNRHHRYVSQIFKDDELTEEKT